MPGLTIDLEMFNFYAFTISNKQVSSGQSFTSHILSGHP